MLRTEKNRQDEEGRHIKYLKVPQLWLDQEQMVIALLLGQMVALPQKLLKRRHQNPEQEKDTRNQHREVC